MLRVGFYREQDVFSLLHAVRSTYRETLATTRDKNGRASLGSRERVSDRALGVLARAEILRVLP